MERAAAPSCFPFPGHGGQAQDPALSISLEREEAEIKLRETQQVREDAVHDALPDLPPPVPLLLNEPCPGTPHGWGQPGGAGQPRGARQLQFVSISPVKSREMKWQQRVINQSVPRPAATFPLGEGYSPAKWERVSWIVS